VSAALKPVQGLSLTDPRCAEVLEALPGLSPVSAAQHTPQLIARTGTVHFHDASLAVWEEGLNSHMTMKQRDAWETQFKRDVFARIIQSLNRLGWTVAPWHDADKYPAIARSHRTCHKGDLKGDLSISGRHIEFKMFQSVNCPTRPDHEGRYESNKEACMPYLVRLEMQRTRNRIRDYLCNVFEGYEFRPAKIASANPDPLAYFNDSWDGEYEKKRGTHRFKRGADGWPDHSEVRERARTDRDGVQMDHGDVRCARDRKGRLLRGRVYGGINEQWMLVYGPGPSDFTHVYHNQLFTYRPGETPAKDLPESERRKKLQRLLEQATKALNFERAAVLRDLLFPKAEALYLIQCLKDDLYFGSNYSGYTHDTAHAGKYTREQLKPYLKGGLETRDHRAVLVREAAGSAA